MFLFVVILLYTSFTNAKIVDRCELAKQLKNADVSGDSLYKWICIGQKVGNTSRNNGGSYGIFQISDRYWCGKKGSGGQCRISCRKLIDDDIRDDIACALKIYNQHKLQTGDGFSAWMPWYPECKTADISYVKECPEGNNSISDDDSGSDSDSESDEDDD